MEEGIDYDVISESSYNFTVMNRSWTETVGCNIRNKMEADPIKTFNRIKDLAPVTLDRVGFLYALCFLHCVSFRANVIFCLRDLFYGVCWKSSLDYRTVEHLHPVQKFSDLFYLSLVGSIGLNTSPNFTKKVWDLINRNYILACYIYGFYVVCDF